MLTEMGHRILYIRERMQTENVHLSIGTGERMQTETDHANPYVSQARSEAAAVRHGLQH